MMKNLFLSFFEISVSTSLMVLVLLIAAPLLNRRYASRWNYYIWIALALRLVLPLNLELSLRRFVIRVPEKITAPVITDTRAAIPITLQAGEKLAGVTLLDFMAVIWSVVCLCLLLIHLYSYLHYKAQIIRNGIYVEDSHILRQQLRLRKDLQIKRKITIIQYSGAMSPMIIGFFRPLLVLPDNEYSQEELYFILKHELIHFKRNDVYVKLLLVVANSIHWFNPLIYLMQKEAGVDMELSCDERVIRGTDYAVRKAYTETLLSTLHKQSRKINSLTTQFYGGNQIMKKRFKNILMKSKKKNGFLILVGAVSATVVLGMMAGCSVTNPGPSEVQSGKEASGEESADITKGQTDPAGGSEPEGLEPADGSDQGGTEPGGLEAGGSEPGDLDSSGMTHPEGTMSEDGQEIKSIAENFAAAYFGGDTDTMQSYLTNPYEWEVEVYEGLDTAGAGAISDLTLKGLTDIGNGAIGSTRVISLEFRDSNMDDRFIYLTMEYVKQEDGWKIQFYGLES